MNNKRSDASGNSRKLDELLRGVSGAGNSLIYLERLSGEELDRPQAEFDRLRAQAPKHQPKLAHD